MRAKPWPQKGTGRARHKSRYGPQWKGGYKVNGPKGPTSFFYVLPKEKRIEGLCTALTVKLHQVSFIKKNSFSPLISFLRMMYILLIHLIYQLINQT
jgi:ribosomal protein L4